jgi:hypothetical protein
MTTFPVVIDDVHQLAGITAAREAYNAALPEGDPPLATDEDYVQFVMTSAAQSYANQYGT